MGLDEKKEIVLKSLIILTEEGIWNIAKPLAIYIHNSKNIDIKLLDIIIGLISKVIIETKYNKKINNLNKIKSKLENIKMLEYEEMHSEKEYLDKGLIKLL